MPFAAVVSRAGATRDGGQQHQGTVIFRADVRTVRARMTRWCRWRGHGQLHLHHKEYIDKSYIEKSQCYVQVKIPFVFLNPHDFLTLNTEWSVRKCKKN